MRRGGHEEETREEKGYAKKVRFVPVALAAARTRVRGRRETRGNDGNAGFAG
jgi:hypothetical protein